MRMGPGAGGDEVVATTAALLISAAVSATTAIAAAKVQANAAKKSAETVAAGAQEASDQATRTLTPWAEQGQQAQQTIGALFGFHGGGRPPSGPGLAPGNNPRQNYGNPAFQSVASAPNLNGGSPTTPPMANPATIGSLAAGGASSSYASAEAPQGGMTTIRLQAPDGSVNDVLERDVPMFLARGAVPISNAAPQGGVSS
jgi:hypothetical protein